MQDLDDKYFFDKVKSVLENFEPDYRPESWTKLSGTLDRHGRTAGQVQWRLWLRGFVYGVLLVGALTCVYFFFMEPHDTDVVASSTNEIPELQPQNQPAVSVSARIYERTGTDTLTKPADPVTAQLPAGVGREVSQESRTIKSGTDEIPDNTCDISIVEMKDDVPELPVTHALHIQKDVQMPVNTERKDSICLSDTTALRSIEKQTGIDSVTTKKKKCFDWKMFRFDLGLDNEGYRKFAGPDRVKLCYAPEIVFGNFLDKAGISNGINMMIEGPLSNRLMLGIGASFRSFSWQNKTEYGTFEQDSTTMSRSKYTVDSTDLQTGRWRYFEIPVELGLKILSDDKWNLGINIAVAAQFMQYERYTLTRITNDDATTYVNIPNAANNRILGSLKFGLPLSYQLDDRWSLWVEPYYKFQLRSFGENNLTPKYLGINAGAVFQFNLHRKKRK